MIKVKIIKFRKILLLVCFSIGFKVLFVLLMISKNGSISFDCIILFFMLFPTALISILLLSVSYFFSFTL